jgi:hypothetical protein
MPQDPLLLPPQRGRDHSLFGSPPTDAILCINIIIHSMIYTPWMYLHIRGRFKSSVFPILDHCLLKGETVSVAKSNICFLQILVIKPSYVVYIHNNNNTLLNKILWKVLNILNIIVSMKPWAMCRLEFLSSVYILEKWPINMYNTLCRLDIKHHFLLPSPIECRIINW